MQQLQSLFALIGHFKADPEAIAALTGLSVDQVNAHIRLGHLLIADGMVVSVKA